MPADGGGGSRASAKESCEALMEEWGGKVICEAVIARSRTKVSFLVGNEGHPVPTSHSLSSSGPRELAG